MSILFFIYFKIKYLKINKNKMPGIPSKMDIKIVILFISTLKSIISLRKFAVNRRQTPKMLFNIILLITLMGILNNLINKNTNPIIIKI